MKKNKIKKLSKIASNKLLNLSIVSLMAGAGHVCAMEQDALSRLEHGGPSPIKVSPLNEQTDGSNEMVPYNALTNSVEADPDNLQLVLQNVTLGLKNLSEEDLNTALEQFTSQYDISAIPSELLEPIDTTPAEQQFNTIGHCVRFYLGEKHRTAVESIYSYNPEAQKVGLEKFLLDNAKSALKKESKTIVLIQGQQLRIEQLIIQLEKQQKSNESLAKAFIGFVKLIHKQFPNFNRGQSIQPEADAINDAASRLQTANTLTITINGAKTMLSNFFCWIFFYVIEKINFTHPNNR
jgi:hypothetical protein